MGFGALMPDPLSTLGKIAFQRCDVYPHILVRLENAVRCAAINDYIFRE